MPVNLQLGNINVASARVSRPQVNPGEGLQALGNAISKSANDIWRMSKAKVDEDSALAMTWFMDKSVQLDELEQYLITNYKDPKEFNQAMGEQLKLFSEFAEQEAKQLGIPTVGPQKLTPRMLQTFDKLQAHRTELFQTAGKSKLAKEHAMFKERNTPLVGVSKQTRTIGTDGGETRKISEGIIQIQNKSKMAHQMHEHIRTGYEIGNEYRMEKEDIEKWAMESQAEIQAGLLDQAIIQAYDDILDPDFNTGTLALETMFTDPVTQEISTVIKRYTGTEKIEILKRAHEFKMARVADKESDRKILEKYQEESDFETSTKLMLAYGNIENPSQVLQAISKGEDIAGVSTKFQTAKAELDMVKSLLEHQRAGGFPRESNREVLDELRVRVYGEGLTDPQPIFAEASSLRDSDFNMLMGEVNKNQNKRETEFQRNYKEQADFAAGFWGKLTNFLGPMEKTESALALKSQTIILNRALALSPEQRTREKLQEITFEVLEEDAREAIKAQLNIDSTLPFEQMSQFNDIKDIDRLPNANDRALAGFLFRMKQIRLGKGAALGPPEADGTGPGERKSKESGDDFFEQLMLKTWNKFKEVLGAITERDKS